MEESGKKYTLTVYDDETVAISKPDGTPVWTWRPGTTVSEEIVGTLEDLNEF